MRHEEAVEGGPADPQKFGGLDLVAAALLEGRRHRAGIEFGDGAPGDTAPPDFLGQVGRPGHLTGAPGQGIVYGVLQFPHIPRPGVAQHQVHRGG